MISCGISGAAAIRSQIAVSWRFLGVQHKAINSFAFSGALHNLRSASPGRWHLAIQSDFPLEPILPPSASILLAGSGWEDPHQGFGAGSD